MENETIEWFGRVDGPLNLRLLLQPTIAAFFGYRDGVKDATKEAPPYFWNVTQVSVEQRRSLIRDGWASVGKVFVLAFILDSVFQYLISGGVAFFGAVVIAAILAILPYLLVRSGVNRFKSRTK